MRILWQLCQGDFHRLCNAYNLFPRADRIMDVDALGSKTALKKKTEANMNPPAKQSEESQGMRLGLCFGCCLSLCLGICLCLCSSSACASARASAPACAYAHTAACVFNACYALMLPLSILQFRTTLIKTLSMLPVDHWLCTRRWQHVAAGHVVPPRPISCRDMPWHVTACHSR